MNSLSSFEDLKTVRLNNPNQLFYYVILLNPMDITPAGKDILRNLSLFDLDSGTRCDYFLPGFLNNGSGLIYDPGLSFGDFKIAIEIERLGPLAFNYKNFFQFYDTIERQNAIGWKYSGGCELLLLEIAEDGSVKTKDIISYNLDDIVRNQRTVSEFLRGLLNITISEKEKSKTKTQIDNLFYSLIMPTSSNDDTRDFSRRSKNLFEASYKKNEYVFISYSTKDFRTVKKIRDDLESAGIACWMAPFDIPSGTNYAYIIEMAIKNTRKFILMLSRNSVQSIWVCNELLRAVTYFGHENPDKLCVLWLGSQFSLDGTSMALPLASVQIQLFNIYSSHDNERIIKLLKDDKNNIIKERERGSNLLDKKSDETTAEIDTKILAQKLRNAILKLNGLLDTLQTYINALDDMAKVDCIYKNQINAILIRLVHIVSTCQSENRTFNREEADILTKDANALLKYCKNLLN